MLGRPSICLGLLLLSSLLSSYSYAWWDEYSQLFEKAGPVSPCKNEVPGLFESKEYGCYQLRTGLEWGIRTQGPLSVGEAQRFCETIPGRANEPSWRLPKIAEIEALFDDLEFLAQRSNLQVKDHLEEGMGVLGVSLVGEFWHSEQAVQKNQTTGSTYTFSTRAVRKNAGRSSSSHAICVRDLPLKPKPAHQTTRSSTPGSPRTPVNKNPNFNR